MSYVYFTKTLQSLNIAGLVAFAKETGIDGFDLTIRPGYPVTPDNALTALPEADKAFRDAGLVIALASTPTNLVDPESKHAKNTFEACAKVGVPAVKIGYFSYRRPYDDGLKDARKRLAGFAKLAERTKVKVCYHTHSGNMLGNNGASLRMLLDEMDPHHVGAFFDTGHTAINGGPARIELDLIRPWLTLVAIKDMAWNKGKNGWNHSVVPVGGGIVRWSEVAQGLRECKFSGSISLHGEYETKDLDERKALAKEELTALKKWFKGLAGKE